MSVMMISQQMIADATKTVKQMFPMFRDCGYEGNIFWCANTEKTSVDFEIEQLFGRLYLYNDLSWYVNYGFGFYKKREKFSVQINAEEFAKCLKRGKHVEILQLINILRFLLYNIENKEIWGAVTRHFSADMVFQLERDMRELKTLHYVACVYYAVEQIKKTDIKWCY